jgi:hypothetical protein
MTGDHADPGLPGRREAPPAEHPRPGDEDQTDHRGTQFQRLIPMPTRSNSVQLLPCSAAAD